MDDLELRNLIYMLTAERAGVTGELVLQLRGLLREVGDAIESVDAGERVNAHLLANYAMLTAPIANWNSLLQVTPVLDKVNSK